MITSDMYADLYSDSDSSALNRSIGSLLTIIDHHNGEDTYGGNFATDVANAEKNLNDAQLEATKKEKVQELIKQVKKFGPPTSDKESIDSTKPKFRPPTNE